MSSRVDNLVVFVIFVLNLFEILLYLNMTGTLFQFLRTSQWRTGTISSPPNPMSWSSLKVAASLEP